MLRSFEDQFAFECWTYSVFCRVLSEIDHDELNAFED